MIKMSTKGNNTLPTSQSSCSSTEPNFLFLVILGLILAINLTIYRRCSEDINRVFVQGIISFCFFFKFYQKQNQVRFSSSLWSRLTGLLLIFIPLLRARLLLSAEGYVLPYASFSCVISVIGYIILITGFKGLKIFKKELIFFGVAFSIFPYLVFHRLSLLMGISNNNILTLISAQFTSFFFWYLGFNSTNEGSIVHVNGGAIDIYFGCTGWYLFILLLQLSLCVLFVFRSSLKNLLLPFLLSFFISFILSIIRLMIMALVVNDYDTFHYWHGSEGSSLFTSVGMIFFWGIIFLKLPNSVSLSLPPINFRARPNPFLLTISIILAVVFVESCFAFFLQGKS